MLDRLFFIDIGRVRILGSHLRSSTLIARSSLTLGRRCIVTLPKPELPATLVLLIDGSQNQRTYWADQLKRCSSDYQIIEADDGQSGLDLHRSQRFDCVVL